MDRRGFIGKALGILVATKVPFIAKAAVVVPSNQHPNLRRLVAICNAFTCEERDLLCYRIYAIFEGDIKIWSPETVEVQRNYDTMKLKFIAAALKIKRKLTLTGLGVVDQHNMLLVEKSLTSNYPLVPGDELTLTYDLAQGMI